MEVFVELNAAAAFEKQKPPLDRPKAVFDENCREEEIRTLDTVTGIHAFQACPFNHSGTSLYIEAGANIGDSVLYSNQLLISPRKGVTSCFRH